jgi:hypothetical protein
VLHEAQNYWIPLEAELEVLRNIASEVDVMYIQHMGLLLQQFLNAVAKLDRASINIPSPQQDGNDVSDKPSLEFTLKDFKESPQLEAKTNNAVAALGQSTTASTKQAEGDLSSRMAFESTLKDLSEWHLLFLQSFYILARVEYEKIIVDEELTDERTQRSIALATLKKLRIAIQSLGNGNDAMPLFISETEIQGVPEPIVDGVGATATDSQTRELIFIDTLDAKSRRYLPHSHLYESALSARMRNIQNSARLLVAIDPVIFLECYLVLVLSKSQMPPEP